MSRYLHFKTMLDHALTITIILNYCPVRTVTFDIQALDGRNGGSQANIWSIIYINKQTDQYMHINRQDRLIQRQTNWYTEMDRYISVIPYSLSNLHHIHIRVNAMLMQMRDTRVTINDTKHKTKIYQTPEQLCLTGFTFARAKPLVVQYKGGDTLQCCSILVGTWNILSTSHYYCIWNVI